MGSVMRLSGGLTATPEHWWDMSWVYQSLLILIYLPLLSDQLLCLRSVSSSSSGDIFG